MAEFTIEMMKVADLKAHPRNYRQHPEEQIAHIVQSLKDYGFYRNIVTARDGTLLAGHGVRIAAMKLGIEELPGHRMDLDPDDPAALKIIALDNELGRFAEDDDRLLTELLKEISEEDVNGLLGTGYDEAALANLLFVSRAASEIESMDEAAAWVGMPGFESYQAEPQLTIRFETDADREKFVEQFEMGKSVTRGKRIWSGWWPPRDGRADPSSAMFTSGDGDPLEVETLKAVPDA